MLRLQRGEATERRTLAALLTQQGKVAWATDNRRDSAAHWQSALALDPECTEAALYLGRLYLRDGKVQQAFHIWDGLAKARPEFLFLAFQDMQAAFRQVQNDAGWERFVRAFTEHHPSDPAGYLALAEWYEGCGQTAEAMHCLRQVVDLDPSCQAAHLALLSLYRVQGIPNEVLETYERLAGCTTQTHGGRFRCLVCDYTSAEPFWKCPGCHAWGTPERRLPRVSGMPITTVDNAQQRSHLRTGTSTPMVVQHVSPGGPPSAA
jgi:lipopolysaccharide biosynthesis regulator YciM